jgi:DNA-binding NarL/FixJ family response regulator
MDIKIALVEDDKKVREGLKALICGTPGFNCIAAYANAEEALEELPEQKPDVVLMDINLPGMSGIECVKILKAQQPALQIIMLTVYEDDDQIFQSLAAGAVGYILKKTPPAKLLEAIEEVHRGGSFMSSQIARRVVEVFQQKDLSAKNTAALSHRENEILSCLAKGYRYKEIASLSGISIETVRTHIRNIYDKLHVHSRTEAVLKYLGK